MTPGQDHRRRVGDRREARPSRRSRRSASISAMRRPPRVTSSRSWRVGVAVALEQGARSRPRAGARSTGSSIAAAERSSRSRWSSSANGRPRVEPDHLEDAVAAVEAVVAQRDRRLGGRGDRAVDRGQLLQGHRREAIRAIARRLEPPSRRARSRSPGPGRRRRTARRSRSAPPRRRSSQASVVSSRAPSSRAGGRARSRRR